MFTDLEAESIIHALIDEIQQYRKINVEVHNVDKIIRPAKILLQSGYLMIHVKEVLQALIQYYEIKK